MGLTRRDFLRSLGYALSYFAFNELFGSVEKVYGKKKKSVLSKEYIPELKKNWQEYMTEVYRYTKFFNGGFIVPAYLTEKNVNDCTKYIVSEKNLYRDYIEGGRLAILFFLMPYNPPFTHPEIQKELYSYFRRAVSALVGKDILEARIEPKSARKIILHISRGEKFYDKSFEDDKYIKKIYEEYLRSPPIALILCKTLVRKNIIRDRYNPIYFDEIVKIDEKKKTLKFFTEREVWKYNGDVMCRVKPEYKKYLGKEIELDSLDDAVKYLYWLRKDVVLVFGGRNPARVPMFGIGQIKDLLKEKKYYEGYFGEISTLSDSLIEGPPGSIKIY